MAGDTDKNKPTLGTGYRKTYTDGAWRVSKPYDENGGHQGTEDLYLSKKYQMDEGQKRGQAVSENMIGYSRRGLRDFGRDQKDSNSVWKTAAIAAPLGIGVGVGIRNLWKNLPSEFGQFKIQSNTNVLKSMIRDLDVKGIRNENFLSRVGEFRHVGTLSPSAIQHAWNVSLKAVDPGNMLTRPLLDSADPLSTIEAFARGNTSLQSNKVLRHFSSQLHSIEKAGGLPQFGSVMQSTFKQTKIGIKDILDPVLQQSLTNIRANLPDKVGMRLLKSERPGMEGSQLLVRFWDKNLKKGESGPFGKGSTLQIPMELADQPGVIVSGMSQQTKRIAGRYDLITADNKIASTLKHEQWAIRKFETQIMPDLFTQKHLTRSEVNRSFRDFNESIVSDTQWIPNTPEGMVPSNDRATKILAPHRRTFISETTMEPVVSEELSNVLRQEGIGRYATTSPNQLAKGKVSTLNAQDLLFGGHQFPVARRPGQLYGRFVGPTASAQAARIKNPLRSRFNYLHNKAFKDIYGDFPIDVMARTLYINEEKYSDVATRVLGGSLGGTGWMTTGLRSELFQETAIEGLNLSTNYPINQKLIDLMKANPAEITDKTIEAISGPQFPGSITGKQDVRSIFKFKEAASVFAEHDILGYDELGKPVHFERGMQIMGGFQYNIKKQGAISLIGKQIQEPSQMNKFYGAAKVNAELVSQGAIDDMVVKGLGVRGVSGSQVVLGMSELKKNRALHNIQMMTALHHFTHRSMINRGKAEKFSHSAFGSSMQDLMAAAGGDNEAIIRTLHKRAKATKLSAVAVGRIFGALPTIYGQEWQTAISGVTFNPNEVAQIEKGVVSGVGQLFYGGKSTAGSMGTVEPRFFELLRGPQYGALGPQMADDIATRMAMDSPELIFEQKTLGSALSSIKYGTAAIKNIDEYKISHMSEDVMNKILKKGGIVDLEKYVDNASKIYIPGSATVQSMAGFTTATGDALKSDLALSYGTFLEKAHLVATGKADREVAGQALGDLVGELGKAHAGTITAKGRGLARGRVPGSAYLDIAGGTIADTGDMYTVGISRSRGMKLFHEMEELYAKDPAELEFLGEQRKRFLNRQPIQGIVARHPFIDLYSAQPTKFKLLDNIDDDVIRIPQRTLRITDIADQALGDVSVGHLAGMSGDIDGDTANLMLGSSKISKGIDQHFTINKHFTHEYENFIIRQQLLKAKAPDVTMTLAEAHAQGARQLAMSKEMVGQISVPMSEMRAALIRHGQQDPAFGGAMNLLSAIENTPISGKHIPANRIDELAAQMIQIKEAGYAGRGKELGGIMKDILKFNPQGEKLLSENIDIKVWGKARQIKGIDLENATNLITSTFSKAKDRMSGMDTETFRMIAQGRRNLKPNQIGDYMQHSGDFLAAFKVPAKSGIGQTISRARLAAGNKIAAAGESILQHAGKPLGIGFAAALGIGAILSTPISNLDPGAGKTPPAKIISTGKTQVDPDSLFPDEGVEGQPTVANHATGNASARVSQSRPKVPNIKILGLDKNRSNISTITQRLSSTFQNSDVNTNIRDHRSSLSQQKIDEIMRR